MTSGMRAHRIFVSGRVQGVGYRWFVRESAAALAIVGYARNVSDGRVEVWAEGDEVSLRELGERLKTGPRYAEVTNLDVTEVSPRGYKTFTTS